MARRRSLEDRLEALTIKIGGLGEKPDGFTVQQLRPNGPAFIDAMREGRSIGEIAQDSRLGQILLAAKERYKQDRPTEISVMMSLKEVQAFWDREK